MTGTEQTDSMALSEQTREEIRRLADRLPSRRSAIIPALYIVHDEEGWLSEESAAEVAEILGETPTEITSVASFYTLFSLAPKGRHVIRVCQSISCVLMGTDAIIERLKARLGIEVGETTDDRLFTLETCECLAACDRGPAMQVDDQYYEHLTPERVDEIIDELRAES